VHWFIGRDWRIANGLQPIPPVVKAQVSEVGAGEEFCRRGCHETIDLVRREETLLQNVFSDTAGLGDGPAAAFDPASPESFAERDTLAPRPALRLSVTQVALPGACLHYDDDL
jgi:hypothetical protein